jgi:hypothetical protein
MNEIQFWIENSEEMNEYDIDGLWLHLKNNVKPSLTNGVYQGQNIFKSGAFGCFYFINSRWSSLKPLRRTQSLIILYKGF